MTNDSRLTKAQHKHLAEMERQSTQHPFSQWNFPSPIVGRFKARGFIVPVVVALPCAKGATYYHVSDAGRAALARF